MTQSENEIVGSLDEETEAIQMLKLMAHGKTSSIPSDFLTLHILRVTQSGDWPIQRAAMEALLRRISFAKRDNLYISSRPAGMAFGLYRTQRKKSSARPYHSLLTSLNPLQASCDCPDFLRNSLGVCKHLLVVLEHLFSNRRRLVKALGEQDHFQKTSSNRLVWDPVRPLTEQGDWLDRVFWVANELASNEKSTRKKEGDPLLKKIPTLFETDSSLKWKLRSTYFNEIQSRLELITNLELLLKSRKAHSADCLSDPALVSLLQSERKRFIRRIKGRQLAQNLNPIRRTLKQKLYPYQDTGVQRFLSEGHLLLADDMGLGKTIQAIAACHVLWHGGLLKRGLLIVPASLKSQWLREWQGFSDVDVKVVEGGPSERKQIYTSFHRGFLIVNYEQVLRDLPQLLHFDPEIVVLDEAQRIKNWATKTAVYVKQLQPAYRLVLTGTPMENRLEELASILDWVDDFALEPKWRLSPWHSTYSDGRHEITGARHLDTLRTRLSHCMLRRIRSDVLSQLPSRTDTRVPVELTEAQRTAHDDLNLPIARILSIGRKRPLAQAEFLRLMSLLTTQRIICNGFAQLNFEEFWPSLVANNASPDSLLPTLSSPKLRELRELIGHIVLNQSRKVVVFSQWRRMLRLAHWAMADLLKEAGLRAVFFTGEESQRRRTHNIIDFHDDPNTRVLLASDAGGVGLNLQKAASACITLEVPWNPAVLEQRVGRIYRLGQKHPIEVYHLVCEEGIESRIVDLVADKKAFFTGLFEGSCDEVLFDRSGSFLSRLEKIVEPVTLPTALQLEVNEEEEVGDELSEIEPFIEYEDRSSQVAPQEVSTSLSDGTPMSIDSNQMTSEVQNLSKSSHISLAQMGSLLETIKIQPLENGGLSIEAPPETVAPLAALFQGMSQLFAGALKTKDLS